MQSGFEAQVEVNGYDRPLPINKIGNQPQI